MASRLAFAVILLLVASFSSYAHDSDRIEQLEREIQETKRRLLILESKLKDKTDEKELVGKDLGRKSAANWRKLATGMSTRRVQKILGYPLKVDGARNATWYYKDGGIVEFNDGYLNSWSFPE